MRRKKILHGGFVAYIKKYEKFISNNNKREKEEERKGEGMRL